MVPEKVKKRILVVDDEPDTRIFISNLLNSDGFKPILAKNKAEGLKKAIEKNPALIIIDMMMSEEGGIQMYSYLKHEEKLKNVPVIVLCNINKKTCYQYLQIQSSRFDQRFLEPNGYLEKPLEAADLLNLVRTLTLQNNCNEFGP